MYASRNLERRVPEATRIPRVLAIAGSDSGGGAGIQADLKAFAAAGVHGMTAITAITAQNTVGVAAVQPIAPDVIVAQVRAVAEDIGVDAVKIGMLGDAATIAAVGDALDLLDPDTPVVLDPVMVAESGVELLAPDARDALVAELVPRVTVVTPNVPEARALAGDPHGEPDDLARAVHALGPRVVVVTGGHRDDPVDVLYDGEHLEHYAGPRHPDGASHGSGCTHSSTLAARLALGDSPREAARAARAVTADAVAHGLRDVGAGAGPVDVLHRRG
jgi:hydroxymethylpyrimidine/phosphomethylpyrimidine kinase